MLACGLNLRLCEILYTLPFPCCHPLRYSHSTCAGAQTRSRVLEAFSSWLQLTPGGGLPGSQLAQHPLVTAALEGLDSSDTFNAAVEALVELIYSTSNKGAPDQDSMALVSRLVPVVRPLSALCDPFGCLHIAGPFASCWDVLLESVLVERHLTVIFDCMVWGISTCKLCC